MSNVWTVRAGDEHNPVVARFDDAALQDWAELLTGLAADPFAGTSLYGDAPDGEGSPVTMRTAMRGQLIVIALVNRLTLRVTVVSVVYLG